MADKREKDTVKKNISRREFLQYTGAIVGSAAIGGSLLTGCTTTTAPPAAEAPANTAPETPAVEAPKGPVTTPVVEKWDYETDVLIIGLGGAGASAAIEAHDAGAKVLVLEKQAVATHFSNSRMSGGVFHNPDPSGDRAARVEYIKAMMSGENCPWKYEGEQEHVSQEMAEMFADGIMEVQNFLLAQDSDLDAEAMAPGGDASFPMFPMFAEAKYGRTVSCRYKGFADADSKVPTYERPKMHKSSGESLMWALIEEGIKAKRPEIEIFYETPAKLLVQRDNGEILGAIAVQNGKEIAVKAKRAVVLSSGGFEYSVELRRAFQEGPGVTGWGFYGSPDNTGDGIKMAMLIGAGLAKVAKSASRIEAAFPTGVGFEKYGLKMGVNTAVTSAPNSVVVDNFGKRYADEHIITDSTRPYRYQFYKEAVKYDMLSMNYTRIPSWSIFDETRRSGSSVVSSGSSVGYGFVEWSNDNMLGIEKGWILKGDTLEELAEKINADPENRNMISVDELKATISKFNKYCAAGEDKDYGRTPDTMGPVDTPPFYAMKLYPGGPNTKGGIDANAKRQALNWVAEPIPRLYTAGEISSVFKFTYQAGGNITECMVCGRLAGKNAAGESPWE